MQANDFTAGDDYVAEAYALTTYGINAGGHGNQIEIHGDEKLRDHVLRLLIQNPPPGDAPPAPRDFSLWPNGVDRTAIAALRYLSTNDRPSGGEQRYNWAHLNQLADELQRAVNLVGTYADERKRDRKLRIAAEERAIKEQQSRDDVVSRYSKVMKLVAQITEIDKHRPSDAQAPAAAPEPDGKSEPKIHAEALKSARTAAMFALPDQAVGVLNREREARAADGWADADPLGEATQAIVRAYLSNAPTDGAEEARAQAKKWHEAAMACGCIALADDGWMDGRKRRYEELEASMSLRIQMAYQECADLAKDAPDLQSLIRKRMGQIA